MTGKELWAQYQHYTRDFTEHARKLGFGGLAVCWLFRDADFRFPVPIYAAMLAFVGYFIADVLQALLGALTLRLFTVYHERRMWRETGTIEGDIPKPDWVDWPATSMFAIKACSVLMGFVFVGVELLRRLF